MNNLSFLAVATGAALQLFAAAPAPAQETAEEAYSEITEAFGFVPTFMREYPEHGIAGAWILTRDLELSEETALSPKIKSLINVAVGARRERSGDQGSRGAGGAYSALEHDPERPADRLRRVQGRVRRVSRGIILPSLEWCAEKDRRTIPIRINSLND